MFILNTKAIFYFAVEKLAQYRVFLLSREKSVQVLHFSV